MGQRDNIPQTLATTSLVSVPNNGTKGDNNGTNHYFFKKRTPPKPLVLLDKKV